MKMPNANEFWIFYQLTVVVCSVLITIAFFVIAYQVWKFNRDAIPRIREIENSLKVLKVDTLLQVKKERKLARHNHQ